MQTDPNMNSQIDLTDHVSIREFETEKEMPAPNVSLSNISELTTFSGDI